MASALPRTADGRLPKRGVLDLIARSEGLAELDRLLAAEPLTPDAAEAWAAHLAKHARTDSDLARVETALFRAAALRGPVGEKTERRALDLLGPDPASRPLAWASFEDAMIEHRAESPNAGRAWLELLASLPDTDANRARRVRATFAVAELRGESIGKRVVREALAIAGAPPGEGESASEARAAFEAAIAARRLEPVLREVSEAGPRDVTLHGASRSAPRPRSGVPAHGVGYSSLPALILSRQPAALATAYAMVAGFSPGAVGEFARNAAAGRYFR